MKTLKAILQAARDIFDVKKYVDLGVLDFSGQGRNQYGK